MPSYNWCKRKRDLWDIWERNEITRISHVMPFESSDSDYEEGEERPTEPYYEVECYTLDGMLTTYCSRTTLRWLREYTKHLKRARS